MRQGATTVAHGFHIVNLNIIGNQYHFCISIDHLGQADAKTSFVFDTIRNALIFAFYSQDFLKCNKMLDPASWQITFSAFTSKDYGANRR